MIDPYSALAENGAMAIRTFFTWIICCVFLVACGGGGGGDQSSTTPITSGSPAAPSRPTIRETGSGRVEITWKGVSNVSNYNIYYRDAPDVTKANGTKVAKVWDPATVTGLQNGTTYYFVVTAENAAGEGPASPEVSATPELKLPLAALNFRATPDNGEVTLEWDVHVDTDSINLYWWTDSESNARQIADATSPFVLTGLVNGVMHKFQSEGVNASGTTRTPISAYHATPIDPATGWTTQTSVTGPRSSGLGGLTDVGIVDDGTAAIATSLIAMHNVDGQWGSETIMEKNAEISGLAIAVTPTGRVVAGYGKDAATVWTRTFENGVWHDPVRVDSMGLHIARGRIDLAADDQGNIFAAWVEARIPQGNSYYDRVEQVWTRRFDGTSGEWGEATMLIESVRGVHHVTIAAAGDNRAVAVWLQDTQERDETAPGGGPSLPVLYASSFNGVDWAESRMFEFTRISDKDHAGEFDVDINETGTAIVAASLSLYPTIGGLSSNQLEVTLIDSSSGDWSQPKILRDIHVRSGKPRVAIDPSGRSIVAWKGHDVTANKSIIEGSVYDPAGAIWAPIHIADNADTEYLNVEVQPNGAAIVVWDHNDEQDGIYYRRSGNDFANWGDINLLGGHIGRTRLAISPNGHIIIAAMYSPIIRYGNISFSSSSIAEILISTYTP